MSFNRSNTVFNAPRLKTFRDWPMWFPRLQVEANIRGVWDLIDPDAPDAPHVNHTMSSAPKRADIKLKILQERKESYDERHEEWRKKSQGPKRGDEPIYDEKEPTLEEITVRYDEQLNIFNAQVRLWDLRSDSYFYIFDWIVGTIDPYAMKLFSHEVVARREKIITLQTMVRFLRDRFAPTESQLAALQQPRRNRNRRRKRQN